MKKKDDLVSKLFKFDDGISLWYAFILWKARESYFIVKYETYNKGITTQFADFDLISRGIEVKNVDVPEFKRWIIRHYFVANKRR